MKTIGVLGGLSWHSTAIYYQYLNQFTANKLGGLHSANINMTSVNFEPIAELMQQNSWQQITRNLTKSVRVLQESGANSIVLANNTLHQVVPELESKVTIPFLHIVDALGEKLTALGITKIGLLGTAATMQSGFYKKRLLEKYQIDVVTPQAKQCQWLDKVIFSELCFGEITKQAQQGSLILIEELKSKGAQAVALACTELPLLLKNSTFQNIPVFDTSLLHCQYAVNWSLEGKDNIHE